VDDFSKQLGGDMRRSLRRRMKRLQEMHTVTFERQDDADTVEIGIKTFVNLHQKKWTSKGREGSFGEDPILQASY
jgi:CelD/BcsL family acetyltransferase involved in cellulose biosynthesis